jgi:maleylacetoacetate isomerase/maleylpyruvate isomerase
MAMKLYSSWRASAPYRVRIGLQLKGLEYDYVGIDLAGSEQHKAPYRAVNPQRLTPTLEVDDATLTQSLAILEWLEETHPSPPLLPKDAMDRATVRAMAEIVACDIHPLNNLRVMRALSAMNVEAEVVQTWARRWITDGFNVLETMIAKWGEGWAFGSTPTLADCCLIPQVYNSERFGVDLDPYPSIRQVHARAGEHPAFQAALPDRQPDATPA